MDEQENDPNQVHLIASESPDHLLETIALASSSSNRKYFAGKAYGNICEGQHVNRRVVRWAGVFLDAWLKRAMRSRMEPIKKAASSIRAHEHLILNWFAAKKEYSSEIVDGLNDKVKLIIRKAYGFRELEVAQVAIYHALPELPEPKLTHEFR